MRLASMGGLRIELGTSGSSALAPLLVRVQCGHGVTVLSWRRTCKNGCHQGPPERMAGCRRIHPTDAQLATLGAIGHTRRLECGCCEVFWMRAGPHHHEQSPAWGVQVAEVMVTDEDYDDLQAAGPSGQPWEPRC